MAEVVNILADVKPLVYFIQCTRYEYVQAALRQLQHRLEASAITGVYANDGRIWQNRGWQGERISPKASELLTLALNGAICQFSID